MLGFNKLGSRIHLPVKNCPNHYSPLYISVISIFNAPITAPTSHTPDAMTQHFALFTVDMAVTLVGVEEHKDVLSIVVVSFFGVLRPHPPNHRFSASLHFISRSHATEDVHLRGGLECSHDCYTPLPPSHLMYVVGRRGWMDICTENGNTPYFFSSFVCQRA